MNIEKYRNKIIYIPLVIMLWVSIGISLINLHKHTKELHVKSDTHNVDILENYCNLCSIILYQNNLFTNTVLHFSFSISNIFLYQKLSTLLVFNYSYNLKHSIFGRAPPQSI